MKNIVDNVGALIDATCVITGEPFGSLRGKSFVLKDIFDVKDSLNCNVIRIVMSQAASSCHIVNGWGLMLIRHWSVASAYNRASLICCGDLEC